MGAAAVKAVQDINALYDKNGDYHVSNQADVGSVHDIYGQLLGHWVG